MASNEDARAAREAKLDELHEKLTGAVEALVSGDDWRQALAFAARFRSRSFNNTMLIWVARGRVRGGPMPEPLTLVAGYRQWQGLGRQVMKGQAGYMIFAPVTGRFARRRLLMRARGVGWGAGEAEGRWWCALGWSAHAPATCGMPPRPTANHCPSSRRRCWKVKRHRVLEGWLGRFAARGSRCCAWSTGMIFGANGVPTEARTVAVRENMDPAAQVRRSPSWHVLMHDPDDQEARQHRGIRESRPVSR